MQKLSFSSFKFLAVTAISVGAAFASVAAQAETYDGVLKGASVLNRADVEAEAQRAAAAPDQNVARGSRGAERFTVAATRANVAKEAERSAAAPDQNVASGSRVNSKVISTLQNPVDARATAAAANASKL